MRRFCYSCEVHHDCDWQCPVRIRERRIEAIWTAVLAVVVVGLILAGAALYGHWMYGDWKCGMPAVHCRKVTP